VGRTGNIALAVLAVLELAAAGYVVGHNDTPKTGAASAAAVGQPTGGSSTSQTRPSRGIDATSATRDGTGAVVVAFLGDDWTAGTGASGKGKRFTTQLSRQFDVQERNFGVDGTGYAKSSDSGGPYASRLAAVVAAQPQVVVVSGGRNDRSDDAATVAERAHRLFATLRARLPDAVLIAVAPFWGDSELPPELVALGDAVRQAVTDAGGNYLDVPDPIHGHPAYMADAGDPNDVGYRTIAAALEPQLAPLLPR
jgi:lysophospholipase L1-like esterase